MPVPLRLRQVVLITADLADISGTHLHPADVTGAIVSLDWADPPDSWRWAGPAWTGGAPDPPSAGGVTGLTVAAVDPAKMAARWAQVLDLDPGQDRATLAIQGTGQDLRFVPTADARDEGIIGCDLSLPGARTDQDGAVTLGGVRFTVTTT